MKYLKSLLLFLLPFSLFSQNVRISDMPAATNLTGAYIPIIQGGINKKAASTLFGSGNVTSVFGRTGIVVAQSGDYNTSQVLENVNLYYTDVRARNALSFTPGSGGYNSTTGVITIPTNNNQLTNGAGYITSFTEVDPVASAINGILRSNGTTLSAVTGTGYSKFSGTTQSFISAIPNGDLANSAITIAGTSTSLGGSISLDIITGVSSNGYLKHTGANTLTNISSIPNGDLANSSITINGISTALGSSITQDQITGLSLTGLVKRTGANTLAIATSGTDYAPATSGSSVLKANGSGGFSAATNADLPAMTSTVGGAVPTPPNNTTTFLRGDGTFATPSGMTNKTQLIGDIYNENFSANTLSSYTTLGSITASVSGGILHLSGGDGTYNNLIYRTSVKNSYTYLYRRVQFKVTANSSAEGIGVGLFSVNTVGSKLTWFVTMDNSSGGTRGTVYLKKSDPSGTVSTLQTSSTQLSYTNSTDNIEIFAEANNNNIEVIVKNITTGAQPVRINYSGSYGSGSALAVISSSAIRQIGSGSEDVTLDVYGSNNIRNPLFGWFGDSVTEGLVNTNPDDRFFSIVSNGLVGRSVLCATGSNDLTDVNNSIISNGINLSPTYVFIMEGINEALAGTSTGTTSTAGTYLYKMQQVINTCINNNIIPIILYSTPVVSGATQTIIDGYNSALTSTYGNSYLVIDIGVATLKGGGSTLAAQYQGDSYHINAAGHQVVASAILNALPHLRLSGFNMATPLSASVSNVGAVNIGIKAAASSGSTNMAINTTAGQVVINETAPTSSLFLFEIAANTSGVSIPLRTISDTNGRSLYLHAKTNASTNTGYGFGFQTKEGTTTINQIQSFSNSNTATLTQLAIVSTALSIGTSFSPNPTALLHLQAGTATANTSPLKFTTGTPLTTPETGVFETSTNAEPLYSTSTTAASRGFFHLGQITSTSGSVTLDGTMTTLQVTATGQTETLPTAVGIRGRIYTIKLTASGSCTVATTSSQTIDGSTTYSLSAQYKYVTVQSDNANWNIIANN